jgi:hypothetical protein
MSPKTSSQAHEQLITNTKRGRGDGGRETNGGGGAGRLLEGGRGTS